MITLLVALPIIATLFADRTPENTRCRFNFSADIEKRRNGEFGFDQLTPQLLKKTKSLNNNSSLAPIEDVYTPIEGIGKHKYYVPWISLRKGQTVTLNVEVAIIKGDKLGTIITKGDQNNLFKITFLDKDDNPSENINTSRKLSIYYRPESSDTTTQNTQLQFSVDNHPTGAINIFHPPPKQVFLKWYAVGRDDREIENIRREVNKKSLQRDLKRAFNPALIDINIITPQAQRLTIGLNERNRFYEELRKACLQHIQENELRGKERRYLTLDTLAREITPLFFSRIIKPQNAKRKEKLLEVCKKSNIDQPERRFNQMANLEKINSCFEETTMSPTKVKTPKRKELIKRVHISSMQVAQKKEPKKKIKLFISYLSSYETQGMDTNINPGGAINGQNTAFIFWGTKAEIDKLNSTYGSALTYDSQTIIPHEIMHTLGLDHTFKKTPAPEVVFKKGETDNYMDYQNAVEHTYKWQWEKMRSSQFVLIYEKIK